MLKAACVEVSIAVQPVTPSSSSAARAAWLWLGAAAESSSLADIIILSEPHGRAAAHEDASQERLQ